MTTIEKSIVIDAPVKDVFAYIEEPVNLLEIWPSMVEIKDVKTLPAGGHQFHWVYKMAGRRLEGDLDTVEFDRDKHFVSKTTGEIAATFDYTFVPDNGRTKVEVKTEYEIPQTLLAKLTEPFLRKLNERESETFLENLKDRLET